MERCFFIKRNPVGIASVDVPFFEGTETCIRGKLFFKFPVCFIYGLIVAYQPEISLLTFLKDNFERIGESAALCIFSENIVGPCIRV